MISPMKDSDDEVCGAEDVFQPVDATGFVEVSLDSEEDRQPDGKEIQKLKLIEDSSPADGVRTQSESVGTRVLLTSIFEAYLGHIAQQNFNQAGFSFGRLTGVFQKISYVDQVSFLNYLSIWLGKNQFVLNSDNKLVEDAEVNRQIVAVLELQSGLNRLKKAEPANFSTVMQKTPQRSVSCGNVFTASGVPEEKKLNRWASFSFGSSKKTPSPLAAEQLPTSKWHVWQSLRNSFRRKKRPVVAITQDHRDIFNTMRTTAFDQQKNLNAQPFLVALQGLAMNAENPAVFVALMDAFKRTLSFGEARKLIKFLRNDFQSTISLAAQGEFQDPVAARVFDSLSALAEKHKPRKRLSGVIPFLRTAFRSAATAA